MVQIKDVPQRRLFRFGLILCLSFLFNHPVLAVSPSSCRGENFDDHVRIKDVIDGDTVILESGEHIRLIGIDTPEIDHEGSASEPGAEAARNYLVQLLHHTDNNRYPISFGQEKYDRYGRTLAYLFLPDDSSIQALILLQGYATPLTMPPNLRYLDCYQKSADEAFKKQRGVWSLPQYRPVDVDDLTGNERGYHLVQGIVSHVSQNRTSIWLNFDRVFAVRIQRTNLQYFEGWDLENLGGETIRVRGKIYKHNRQLRMYLSHGADIQHLLNKGGTR